MEKVATASVSELTTTESALTPPIDSLAVWSVKKPEPVKVTALPECETLVTVMVYNCEYDTSEATNESALTAPSIEIVTA